MCVNHRITVVVATVGIFALSIVGFGHVQQQFFPLSERPELFLQLPVAGRHALASPDSPWKRPRPC